MSTDMERNASLATLSSFRLPARTAELARLTDPAELPALLDTPQPIMLLGEGSNTLFTTDFNGRIVLNRLRGIDSEVLDRDRVLVTAAAGENWHQLVRWSLDRGLWGLENLALIPGSVGAAPMQNIGAYGVELAHCLDSVQVYDRSHDRIEWLPAADCGLDYRDSRFKSAEPERFVILAVRMELSLDGMPVLEYPSLLDELKQYGHAQPDDPRTIAAAVIRIRKRKLPDPDHIANAGSFFKNPVLPDAQAQVLIELHPELPHWPDRHGHTKLSAAWLIDQLGWRGKSIGDAAVHEAHALVLINRGKATGEDVLQLARAIRKSVDESYGVGLEVEPVLVGSSV